MNMRAAEATVSSAPKPMKIFPISEVWSQVELSPPLATTGAARATGASAAAVAWAGAAGVLSCSARSTSLSWSAETTWVSAVGCASAGLFGAACRILLARTDIARALPSGTSEDGNCAWALATDGGIADELSLSSAAARSLPAAFLSVEDFSATSLDLRCAYFFQWCLLRVMGAAAALSGVALAAALFAPAAAWDGPAKHTQSPVASINAECPLALIIIWQSPHLPAPKSEMRPHGMSAARRKKGIFW